MSDDPLNHQWYRPMSDDPLIGQWYRHYKGALYKVVGFSLMSDDSPNYDGQRIVHYENIAGDRYTCLASRWIKLAWDLRERVARFAAVKGQVVSPAGPVPTALSAPSPSSRSQDRWPSATPPDRPL